MESCQYRGYQIDSASVVELVRERLSHTLRHTDLAATDFAHYDAANGRCGSRGQAEHRPHPL